MIWFTSDQHFGHKNVIQYCNRPFKANVNQAHEDALGDMTIAEYDAAIAKDVIEMNETIMRNYNRLVKPDDIVFMLGDFSLGKEAVRCILPQLNGYKYLIKGNHDWCHPVHAKSPAKQEKMDKLYIESGFRSVGLQAMVYIAGQVVQLHHMPYQTSNEEERYHKLRPIDEDQWLIHGHVHTEWKLRNKMINVGVDQWDMKPVSIVQIREIINGTHT